MRSLRARLLAGLLALAAAGLLLLAGITYGEQRSFLLDRVDQQARAAVPAVAHQLGGDSPHAFPGGAPPAGGAGYGTDPDDDGKGPPGVGVNLPPGTYGEVRSASGRVLDHVVLSYGEDAPARPDIPARLEADHVITVGSKDGDMNYRVLAAEGPPGTGEATVVAVPLHDVDETLQRLLLVEGLVIAGVLLALGAMGWLVVRLGLRPLDRIAATAGAIAAGDLSRRVSPATDRTEVGRLGLALNGMLSRLERAFAERRASEDRLRTFLADASHELRTPLSSIRGYAELFRMGATEDPAERARAMERIEQEAARMGVLVEDLLTLARLGEVRDPVREDVDLGRLAADAVDDARAIAPDRDIEVAAPAGAIVKGDPHQLHQVAANLLNNALAHTPPGTPIEVTARRDGDGAVLEVRDHGQGLPPGDSQALFERFWRADEGRRRGRAGAGLGLAIVAGIVDAHGGAVRAQDAQGGGARFVVRLPLAAAAAAGAAL
jgi:two-component system OmpR family sensor kinase